MWHVKISTIKEYIQSSPSEIIWEYLILSLERKMDNSGAFMAPWALYGAHNLTAEQCSSEGKFRGW